MLNTLDEYTIQNFLHQTQKKKKLEGDVTLK